MSKPGLGPPAAGRETGDDTPSAVLLQRTGLKAGQSAVGAARFDTALAYGAVSPVKTGADAAVAPPAVAAAGDGDAAMLPAVTAKLDDPMANTPAEAAPVADLMAADGSSPATPPTLTLPPLLAAAVEPGADAPPPAVSAGPSGTDMATRSPPVLIAPANTIAPQGEITRAAAQGPTVAAAGITDAPPGTHVRAAVVDAIGQAAATGAAVAQPDGPPPAVMSPAEGTPIGSAIAQDASANGENSHREKASGQHPDTAVERVAAKLKPEAEELRRDLPPVPAFAPHAQSAAAATSPIASIAVANAVGAIVSPLNVAAAAAAPHPETPEAGVPITGLAVEIAARALEGKRRFEIRLDPPELGRIDVRLDVGRDGQVTSRLVVERAETLDLLRRDAATLERALQSAGLRTDDAGLQFSLRDQSAGRWAGVEATPRSHLLIVPDADVAVHEAVRRGYGVLRGLGRGVDISV